MSGMRTMNDDNSAMDDRRSWPSRMAAWQIDSYGAIENLTLNSEVELPDAVGSEEVVVRVRASSVNPIDALMAGKSNRQPVGTSSAYE